MLVDSHVPKLIIDKVSVYKDYSCVLTCSDVTSNVNKYCTMQLLCRIDKRSYFVFTCRGRVGQAGLIQLDCYVNVEHAVAAFTQLFLEKTGTLWGNDSAANSVSIGKYKYLKPVIIDVTTSTASDTAVSHGNFSTSIVELLHLLFDVENFIKLTQLNNSLCPLAMLDKDYLKTAYSILAEISNILSSGSGSGSGSGSIDSNIETLSSKFYTIIPTKARKLHVIDTAAAVADKLAMLDALSNLYVFSKVTTDNIASKYKFLNTDIHVIDANTSEYRTIARYFNLTKSNAAFRKNNIINIYSVNRHGSSDVLDNTHLLWHGSKTCNMVSILANGLCLNPLGVMRTGAMFGNGLYFANTAGKSLNYCQFPDTEKETATSILLLCSVALGTSVKKYLSCNKPDDADSVHAVGKNGPLHTYTWNGMIVPDGKILPREEGASWQSALNYDEFIVYNESRVNIKYLVTVAHH